MKKLIPLLLLLLVVVFAAGCDLAGITVTPSTQPPAINSFGAGPPTIAAGESSTLSWSVVGATMVSIDQGIGNVALSGNRAVMPSATTVYTLTATNAAGMSTTATAQVIVTGAPPPAGEPDLVIQDISRSGDIISYTINNQGDATAGSSTSTLFVDGVLVANDSVGSLAPGTSKTETFASYTYDCTLPGDAVEVQADTGGAVAEGSEANNSHSESWSCLIIGPIRTLKLPDLVIEDIWLVHEITGDKIYYRIKNKGDGDAGATTAALFKYPCLAPCSPVATDSVLPLAAGASREEKFASYNFTGTGSLCGVGVEADINGDFLEEDEGNNSMGKSCSDL